MRRCPESWVFRSSSSDASRSSSSTSSSLLISVNRSVTVLRLSATFTEMRWSRKCSPPVAILIRWSVSFSSSGCSRPGADTTTMRRRVSSATIFLTFSIWVAFATELPPNLLTTMPVMSLPDRSVSSIGFSTAPATPAPLSCACVSTSSTGGLRCRFTSPEASPERAPASRSRCSAARSQTTRYLPLQSFLCG